MAAYFLEHIRNKYKLSTGQLDDEFISLLQKKTGQPDEELRLIIFFIKHMDDVAVVTDEELAEFHKNLEAFYKVTWALEWMMFGKMQRWKERVKTKAKDNNDCTGNQKFKSNSRWKNNCLHSELIFLH